MQRVALKLKITRPLPDGGSRSGGIGVTVPLGTRPSGSRAGEAFVDGEVIRGANEPDPYPYRPGNWYGLAAVAAWRKRR